jgi:hypothetical protein
MPITSFPREPGFAGGKADYRFVFIGPLEAGQDGLIPVEIKRDAVKANQIEAYIHPDEDAPTGRDVIAAVYLNGVEIDQITITAGTRDATPVVVDPELVIEAYDKVTAKVLQTGSGRRGGTLSVYLRIAS